MQTIPIINTTSGVLFTRERGKEESYSPGLIRRGHGHGLLRTPETTHSKGGDFLKPPTKGGELLSNGFSFLLSRETDFSCRSLEILFLESTR